MKNWYDLYIEEIESKKGIKNYIEYKIKTKVKLIKLIKKYSKNKKIMEAGCGTGIISSYMSSLDYNVVAIDINDKILKLAEEISNNYIKNSNPNFIKKDLFKLDFANKEFDVIFSNGVLEHFTDDEIKEILKLQLEQANVVIVGIPTQFFRKEKAMHGDERYLKIKYWRNLFKECGAKILEEKSYHYMTFIEKIKNLDRILKPKPFKIFVLKK